jgi:hypothetical protein|tara:strand:+ start:616 stop:888 length:273 start_codon:yes stop_codon:yes gene_type:complete
LFLIKKQYSGEIVPNKVPNFGILSWKPKNAIWTKSDTNLNEHKGGTTNVKMIHARIVSFLVAPILVVPPIFKIITVLQTIIKQDIELCLI